MNILEAFEQSDKIKIWDNKLPAWVYIYKNREGEIMPTRLIALDNWEPVIEPLTFERIKRECVHGETLLAGSDPKKLRLFLGFNRAGNLVTDTLLMDGATEWDVLDIRNWQISSEKWEGEWQSINQM